MRPREVLVECVLGDTGVFHTGPVKQCEGLEGVGVDDSSNCFFQLLASYCSGKTPLLDLESPGFDPRSGLIFSSTTE